MNITDVCGTVSLSNGVKMPYLGLGVYKSQNGNEVIHAVHYALDAGYRHIDTAALYQNEEGVGKAVADASIDRKDLFITSKVWNTDQGYDPAIRAFYQSLSKLKTDYLDLYLVHWPVEGKYKDTWRALETLYDEGKIKAIGVSNFLQHHLEDLLQAARIAPMVDQLEFHPRLIQPSLLDFCKQQQIQYEAWAPLMQGRVLDLSELGIIAGKYDKSIAQLVLRWDLQKGVVTIPKSVHKNRVMENAALFDFEISEEDMLLIDTLDCKARIGPDPDHFSF